jgi:hypothetical protein
MQALTAAISSSCGLGAVAAEQLFGLVGDDLEIAGDRLAAQLDRAHLRAAAGLAGPARRHAEADQRLGRIGADRADDFVQGVEVDAVHDIAFHHFFILVHLVFLG